MIRCTQCSNRATTDNGMCESCRVQDDRDRESVFKKPNLMKAGLMHGSIPMRLANVSRGNPGGPSPNKIDPQRVDRQYNG